MDVSKFIEPKSVKIGKRGEEREYIISQIPAAEAIEMHNTIVESVAKSGMIGLTMIPVALKKRIVSFTAFVSDSLKVVPDTDQLINDIFGKGHLCEFEELVIVMIKSNFGFLVSGDLLERLLGERAEATDSVS